MVRSTSGYSSRCTAAVESLHLALRSQLVAHFSDTICEQSEVVIALSSLLDLDDDLLCCTPGAVVTDTREPDLEFAYQARCACKVQLPEGT